MLNVLRVQGYIVKWIGYIDGIFLHLSGQWWIGLVDRIRV